MILTITDGKTLETGNTLRHKDPVVCPLFAEAS
jgi:hypothetical protein